MNIIKTHSGNPDFIALVRQLDQTLAITDGDEHAFYDQFNKLDNIQHVVIAYLHDHAVGCGAIKKYDASTMEIKRMYTLPEYRGKGIASRILRYLENWALELGYSVCILETGKRQQDAVALYEKNGYCLTEKYGPYQDMDNSLCFRKVLG